MTLRSSLVIILLVPMLAGATCGGTDVDPCDTPDQDGDGHQAMA